MLFQLFDFSLEALEILVHLRQPIHVGIHTLVLIEWLNGYAPPNTRSHDLAR